MALDRVNAILKRRCIVFLISDFLADVESYQLPMLVANRRHDVVAFDLSDPLEHNIPDVGIIALEDAEGGRLRWVDTGDRKWRKAFSERVAGLEKGKADGFCEAGVDRIRVTTEKDYITEVGAFFRNRLRRRSR